MSNPFDMNGMGALLGGLQQRMEQMKAEISQMHIEGQAGGGIVKVVVTGDFEVVSVSIDEGAMEDREMLEDLLVAAQNNAVAQARAQIAAKMQQVTGGLPIPPGMLPF